jgi:hypothetical protein
MGPCVPAQIPGQQQQPRRPGAQPWRGVRRRSEVDRRLDSLVAANGRLRDSHTDAVVRMLRLFNLCDVGPSLTQADLAPTTNGSAAAAAKAAPLPPPPPPPQHSASPEPAHGGDVDMEVRGCCLALLALCSLQGNRMQGGCGEACESAVIGRAGRRGGRRAEAG